MRSMKSKASQRASGRADQCGDVSSFTFPLRGNWFNSRNFWILAASRDEHPSLRMSFRKYSGIDFSVAVTFRAAQLFFF